MISNPENNNDQLGKAETEKFKALKKDSKAKAVLLQSLYKKILEDTVEADLKEIFETDSVQALLAKAGINDFNGFLELLKLGRKLESEVNLASPLGPPRGVSSVMPGKRNKSKKKLPRHKKKIRRIKRVRKIGKKRIGLAKVVKPAAKPKKEPKAIVVPSVPEKIVASRGSHEMLQIPGQPAWYPTYLHITIDDGPRFNQKQLPKILDALDKHGVKATFFFVGLNLRKIDSKKREVLKRLINSGHHIAYHSMEHKHVTDRLEQQPVSVLKADIVAFQKLLNKTLGFEYKVKIGRMPGGSGTKFRRVIRSFHEMGLEAPKYWHAGQEALKGNYTGSINTHAKELHEKANQSDYIILLHEHANTGRNLDRFLQALKDTYKKKHKRDSN